MNCKVSALRVQELVLGPYIVDRRQGDNSRLRRWHDHWVYHRGDHKHRRLLCVTPVWRKLGPVFGVRRHVTWVVQLDRRRRFGVADGAIEKEL